MALTTGTRIGPYTVSLREFPNRDPADELIVASARVHKLILVTTDAKLKDYHHARVHYFKPALRAKRT